MLLRQNLEPCSLFFLDDFKYLKPIRENSSVETAYAEWFSGKKKKSPYLQ